MTGLFQALVLAAAALTASDAPSATLTASPASQAAPEPTPASPSPTTPPPAPVDGSKPAEAPDGKGWVDASHDRVERGINALVLRLDRFFGETAHEEADEAPSSRIRLRNEVRTGEDDAFETRLSISGSLRLPAADRLLSRFSLLITGETDPNPAPGNEVDRVPPRFDARVRAASGALELRYDLFRASRTLVDAGAGVRLDMPPPPYTRLRLSQGFPLGARVLGHLSQSVFWDRNEGFGETTRLDVDRAFGTRTLARWWSVGTVDEVSRGYEWTSEVGVQRALGARTGLYTAAAIAGATAAVADVDQYRIYTRLRRDVYGGWTFIEVEPDIAWPADELTGRRSRVLGVILRLEIQFSTDGSTATPLASVPAQDASPGVLRSSRRRPGA
jgi:hypothetical protein